MVYKSSTLSKSITKYFILDLKPVYLENLERIKANVIYGGNDRVHGENISRLIIISRVPNRRITRLLEPSKMIVMINL